MSRCSQIAFFTEGLFPFAIGGIQKFTSLSTKHLALAGVSCHVFYIADSRHPDPASVHRAAFDGLPSVFLHPVPPPRRFYFPGHYYWTCWRQSACMLQALLDSGVSAHLIYAHGYSGWQACWLRRRGRADVPPVAVHGHGLEALQEDLGRWGSLRNSFAPVWQRRILRLADFNLSLGGTLDDVIAAATQRRDNIVSAPNGIADDWLAMSERARSQPDQVRFLFVGRDSVRKGFPELNAATQALLAEDIGMELHVVGPIGPANRIDHAKVVYHGEIKDEARIREIYQSCDVLLVPSYSEGMPTVILEAMASGLAVIATDVGGVRTVVDEQIGWLIPPRDAAQLATVMRSATNTNLQPLRNAAFQRAHAFTWTNAARTFLASLEAAQHHGTPHLKNPHAFTPRKQPNGS
jgi:glycosyltransferase involved in cell wall biosynthesis